MKKGRWRREEGRRDKPFLALASIFAFSERINILPETTRESLGAGFFLSSIERKDLIRKRENETRRKKRKRKGNLLIVFLPFQIGCPDLRGKNSKRWRKEEAKRLK